MPENPLWFISNDEYMLLMGYYESLEKDAEIMEELSKKQKEKEKLTNWILRKFKSK